MIEVPVGIKICTSYAIMNLLWIAQAPLAEPYDIARTILYIYLVLNDDNNIIIIILLCRYCFSPKLALQRLSVSDT